MEEEVRERASEPDIEQLKKTLNNNKTKATDYET